MTNKRTILRQSLPDIIADDVRERILSGELSEGETIRQEALAVEYDVSRMPIREALKRLDAEGLVQLTTNKGATVIKHSLREIGEIFDLRILIEVDMFRRAIPKMTAADFARCQKLVNKMGESYEANDVAKWGGLNFEYHSSLYAAADRKLTKELLQKISLLSDRYVRMHLTLMHHLEPVKDEHHQLLILAENQKIDEACELLTTHISRAKNELLELIAENRNDKKT
jgi:DNA-binding GntR family transcriptional regulator